MPIDEPWKAIVASSLDWEEAHLGLDSALKGLPGELRGLRPDGLPHSPWELVEHIRIAQHDLLDFCRNSSYKHELNWPDDYWPPAGEQPSDDAWKKSIAQLRADREALKQFTTEPGRDLSAKIPHGTGQTYLRTILVAADHAAYHLGELVAVRRLLGAWPPA
jgi:DinB family protein